MSKKTNKNKAKWITIQVTDSELELIKTIQSGLMNETFQKVPLSKIFRAIAVSGIANIDRTLAIEDPTLVFQMENHCYEMETMRQ